MNLKISYNWLKEYIKIDKSVKDFAKEFSLKSQTVESIKDLSKGLEKVVVGKLLAVEKHPNADKLHVAKVDIGRKISLSLIFGQMIKLKVGDQLPVAVAPVKLPSDLSIKKTKIRGVVSEGMFCLNSELGLSDQNEAIFFDAKIKPGTPIIEALKLNDYLLDIEITSNRPDAMSVVGLAREAAAVFGKKLNWLVPRPNLTIGKKLPFSVQVLESKPCPRYQAVVMSDVKVGPSPLWLQARLINCGIRPINNLVDITNYILLEYGQPMHVFDYEKIKGNKIIVRKAKKGEKILALDGKTYQLKPEHLVIADTKAPIAMAGVMGGELSAVTPKTKNIVFECANFNPVLIRKTARELNLHSESSDLFAKNLSPEATSQSILRAIELTQKIAGGQAASEIFNFQPKKYQPLKIKFDFASLKRYLAIEISANEVKKILESLGFKVSGSAVLNVEVPYWRVNDVHFEHDLIEEIARIYGYHRLPVRLPQAAVHILTVDKNFFWEEKIKNLLVSAGLTEVYNYSLVNGDLLKKVGFSPNFAIKLNNSLNEDLAYLRTTLIGQILQNISENQKNFSEQKIFELSHIYLPAVTKTKPLKQKPELPKEILKLTGAIFSRQPNLFLQAKGLAELLLAQLGILNYQFKTSDPQCPIWQKDQILDVYLGNKFLGQFGRIKAEILEKFDVNQSVAIFDFDFSALVSSAKTAKIFQAWPEYPAVSRDLAIVIDQKISWQEISDQVKRANQLIAGAQYLSTFVNSEIGAGKKSLAFRLTFQAKNRTLKTEEVEAIMKKVVSQLEKKFAAKTR